MIAFDTGPGNMLMDGIMRHYSKGKKLYDKNGAAASKGKVDEKLFKKLMSDEYYNYRPPKSTGADKFGIKAVSDLYKLIQSKKITFEDMMRTLLKLTVETMAAAYEKFIFPRYRVGKIVLSGGGTKNSYLVNELMKRLPGYEILISDEVGIPADAKEAIGMAVLANELISGNKTGLPSCTGAKRNVPLGKVSYNF
ncbi:MAG: hypothetical protein GTN99_03875 [Candidatus Dadabacteria bacterium]|nr:hypothetical protein [Candidatus Dadabacteria bacterium]